MIRSLERSRREQTYYISYSIYGRSVNVFLIHSIVYEGELV